MKKTTIVLSAYLFVITANAAIYTIEHNIPNLPSSGYDPIDLDDDRFYDINLASNFYISIWDTWGATEFIRSYSLIGDVIDFNLPWTRGNDWPNPSDYVQGNYLYLAIRNTSIGNYYGYITYDYHQDSHSVSLKSYTYENSGSAITVAAPVPEPTSVWLLGSGLVTIIGVARRRTA